MADMTALDFTVLIGIALVLSLVVVWISGLMPDRRAHPAPMEPGTTRHFLFRDGALVDTDVAEFTLPEPQDADESDWLRFRRWLAPRFDLPETVENGKTLQDGAARLALVLQGATLRVTLSDPETCAVARHDLLHRLSEATQQGAALMAAPLPMWLRDPSGRIRCENRAASTLSAPDRAELLAATVPGRIALESPSRWYDMTIETQNHGQIHYARDVTASVLAEQAQRDFIRTLGKTFADLPTGLAIFDRNRSLAMFNPALVDLTGLDPVFLSARPGILDFFDTLRDRQVMPEPRNYANWRTQIDAMIRAADDGQYQDVWSLVNGRTYRVTGRPHPNGAVAFLFADISDEVAVTRDQRIALDLRQAALDRVEEAVAVLARDGALLFCNRRFALLTRLAPEARTGLALPDLLAICRTRFPRATLWQSVEDRIRAGAVSAFAESAMLDHGTRLAVRLMPLGQGRALLSLHHVPAHVQPGALTA
ncbi:PAS-domain containing protein [Roseovarius autotrophicus]|uniref:PAS-domain containing protein n=1 Tax=Roseovarius autotrophicus TaxID=2824121 RepID=UPI001B39A813|nr:PAS-domain containing protein [Roseovarius autotrophicus]